jgi:hypothetical protein
MSPNANQTLRWLSISVLLAVGVAVVGAIMLLVAICLNMGAQNVSDALTLLSTP